MSSFYTSNVIVHGRIAPRDCRYLTFVAVEAGKGTHVHKNQFLFVVVADN